MRLFRYNNHSSDSQIRIFEDEIKLPEPERIKEKLLNTGNNLRKIYGNDRHE